MEQEDTRTIICLVVTNKHAILRLHVHSLYLSIDISFQQRQSAKIKFIREHSFQH